MFMLSKMHALAVGGADGDFAVNAVDFDGTNDYLTRGAGLTGAADSSTGILSVWLRLDGGNGANMEVWCDDALFIEFIRDSTDRFKAILYNAAGNSRLEFRTVTQYTANAAWRHFLLSWNTAFSASNKLSHLYVNDVSDKSVVSDIAASFNIDYTRGNWGFGAVPSASQKFNGCMAEFYFAMGQYLDFSVEANRRKFISATGKPVSLGADGSLPTGSAPTVYLNNPAASFGTNKGTGGNFTITGTLDTASTSPSD